MSGSRPKILEAIFRYTYIVCLEIQMMIIQQKRIFVLYNYCILIECIYEYCISSALLSIMSPFFRPSTTGACSTGYGTSNDVWPPSR